jgi:hypothetical protein
MIYGLIILSIFSLIYFLVFLIASIINIRTAMGITEVMEKGEDMLYLTSLLLIMGITGSIILLKNKRLHL